MQMDFVSLKIKRGTAWYEYSPFNQCDLHTTVQTDRVRCIGHAAQMSTGCLAVCWNFDTIDLDISGRLYHEHSSII